MPAFGSSIINPNEQYLIEIYPCELVKTISVLHSKGTVNDVGGSPADPLAMKEEGGWKSRGLMFSMGPWGMWSADL